MQPSTTRFSPAAMKAALKASDTSKEVLAVAIGRGYPAVCAYLNGERIPPLSVLCAIADALGVPPESLLDSEQVSA
jgi:transcriptional regulator with XRE-family HTH domain